MMQLFTLGLMELNPDGSAVVDSNNNPIPTLYASDRDEYGEDHPGGAYPTAPGTTLQNDHPAYYFGQMFAVEANHDTTAKAIFGNITLPAGATAEQDLSRCSTH